jgi:hypothetical protein
MRNTQKTTKKKRKKRTFWEVSVEDLDTKTKTQIQKSSERWKASMCYACDQRDQQEIYAKDGSRGTRFKGHEERERERGGRGRIQPPQRTFDC